MSDAPVTVEQREPWARPDCQTCGGRGFVWCLPRDGGKQYRCQCGNCWEAAHPTSAGPDPAALEARVTAALVSMVRDGISPDVQEMLCYGDGRGRVPPKVLHRAIAAALSQPPDDTSAGRA